ncbi:hypothetical protein ACFV2C_08505 [[Kitasatospora] papulosa]|uniref:hypothetical protein n=1 Tax=[Kitasatospora] papulosa TaxID=1464011 RepID=UPI0036C84ABB
MQFRGQQHAGPCRHFSRERASQAAGMDRPVRDGFQAQTLAGGRGHPPPQPVHRAVAVEALEGTEQQLAGLGIGQLLGQGDGADDLLDDDPFITLAAPAGALDDLADEAMPGQARGVFLCRSVAADPQLHQLAGPHAG